MRRHLQSFEHQRRHGVHAGIARTDQRHSVTAGRERERLIHAIRFFAQRIGVPDLVSARRQHVEVASIAHQMRGAGDGPVGRGCSPRGRARSEPDDRQYPAGLADLHRIDRRRRFANRAGRAP